MRSNPTGRADGTPRLRVAARTALVLSRRRRAGSARVASVAVRALRRHCCVLRRTVLARQTRDRRGRATQAVAPHRTRLTYRLTLCVLVRARIALAADAATRSRNSACSAAGLLCGPCGAFVPFLALRALLIGGEVGRRTVATARAQQRHGRPCGTVSPPLARVAVCCTLRVLEGARRALFAARAPHLECEKPRRAVLAHVNAAATWNGVALARGACAARQVTAASGCF